MNKEPENKKISNNVSMRVRNGVVSYRVYKTIDGVAYEKWLSTKPGRVKVQNILNEFEKDSKKNHVYIEKLPNGSCRIQKVIGGKLYRKCFKYKITQKQAREEILKMEWEAIGDYMNSIIPENREVKPPVRSENKSLFKNSSGESTCFVYFIENPDTNNIKIGLSNDPLRRLRELKTGCGSNLKLIGVLGFNSTEEAKRAERELHIRFREDRIVLDDVATEWFRCHAKDGILLILGEVAA